MQDDDVQQRIAYLRAETSRHDALYYRDAKPEISDRAYDELKAELADLEARYPLFAESDSPTRKVGDDRLEQFESYRHRQQMLSLDNTYNEGELFAFDERLRKVFGVEKLEYCVEPKIDGLAIALTFEQGKLVRAVTRGNGIEGDDVTPNIRTIRSLPDELKGEDWPAVIEIRGEVYMTNAEFERINTEREKEGKPLYANPRNLAAGTVKLLDSREVARRRLELVLYGVGYVEGSYFQKQSEIDAAIRGWGLPALEKGWPRTVEGIDAAWAVVQELDDLRHNFSYATDGAVLKLESIAGQAEAGTTSKAPRWAIAYKFETEQAETKLHAISIQVGRTGALTPVAELEPVQLAGTTVKRATLHNEDEIRRKDIRIGDTVVVEKAGEIIPAVVRVVADKRPEGTEPFDFGSFIKEKGYTAARAEGQAVWRLVGNESPEQLRRRLEHFAGRQAMDIEGLGKAVIEQLVARELVADIADIYDLKEKRDTLLELEKFAEKSVDNLLYAIEQSKANELWRLVHGLGIAHVGAQGAKDLVKALPSLDRIADASVEDLQEIDGIGEIVAQSIRSFFENETNRALMERLRAAGLKFAEDTAEPEGDSLEGKTFVLTGTLPTMTRDEAKELIEAHGGRVASSVSKKTSYVVAGEAAGSKLEKANKLAVAVLDEDGLKMLVSG